MAKTGGKLERGKEREQAHQRERESMPETMLGRQERQRGGIAREREGCREVGLASNREITSDRSNESMSQRLQARMSKRKSECKKLEKRARDGKPPREGKT